MQQTAHRPKNATLERGMLLTIRAPPSYPCRSVCYSGAPRRSPPAWARRYSCGLMGIENLFRYPALAVGLMGIENLFRYPALAVGLMEVEK